MQPWTKTVKIGDQFKRDGLLCEVASVKVEPRKPKEQPAPALQREQSLTLNKEPSKEKEEPPKEPTLVMRMLEGTHIGTLTAVEFSNLEPLNLQVSPDSVSEG